MRQKYRLYNRQLFYATITIGRHIFIRNDAADDAFVILCRLAAEAPSQYFKVHRIMFEYVNWWLTLLL